LIWTSLGVALVVAAAQLAVAQALGLVRWDGSYPAGRTDGWLAVLTWIAFIYAVAVFGGATTGIRTVRRPTRPDTMAARLAAALSAGVGAGIAISIAWLPAQAAQVGVHPELRVVLTAGSAIVAGTLIALVALCVPPFAGGVWATVAWTWCVGIGSAAAGHLTHPSDQPPRLAMIDAPSVVPADWWTGPMVIVGVAVIFGVGVATMARWGGARRPGVALAGAAGPAVVAVAYLIADGGTDHGQVAPFRAAMISV